MVGIFSLNLINKHFGVQVSKSLFVSLNNRDGDRQKWLALYQALQTWSHLKDYNMEMSYS